MTFAVTAKFCPFSLSTGRFSQKWPYQTAPCSQLLVNRFQWVTKSQFFAHRTAWQHNHGTVKYQFYYPKNEI